jgi:hypothetical protein
MALKVEELEDQSKYRQLLKIDYGELVPFILDYLRRRSLLIISYWAICIFFLGVAILVRVNIEGHYLFRYIFRYTILGLVVFPVGMVPVHEVLHIIPYYLTGARNIRIGMDLSQYLFYVTAHRHVATRSQFTLVALFPFIVISAVLMYLVFILPGLWKWSLSLLLFVHATMCAGDFALLNFYTVNPGKRIFTWDDADEKTSYFYEEIV